MCSVNDEEFDVLRSLGSRLESLRLARNEKQGEFAARIGVSIPTYRRMCQGSPNTQLGYWVRAARLLDVLDQFSVLLTPPPSQQIDKPVKRRVGRKTGYPSIIPPMKKQNIVFNAQLPKYLPFLEAICWQTSDMSHFSYEEILSLYERGWVYKGVLADLEGEEREFVKELASTYKSWISSEI